MKSEAYIVTCLAPMVIILWLCILALDVIPLERVPISRRHMCNLRLCAAHQLDLVVMISATLGIIALTCSLFCCVAGLRCDASGARLAVEAVGRPLKLCCFNPVTKRK